MNGLTDVRVHGHFYVDGLARQSLFGLARVYVHIPRPGVVPGSDQPPNARRPLRRKSERRQTQLDARLPRQTTDRFCMKIWFNMNTSSFDTHNAVRNSGVSK